MEKNIPDNNDNKPNENKLDVSTYVSPKVHEDTQAAILRNIYIPKILRDHLKKPSDKNPSDDGRGR